MKLMLLICCVLTVVLVGSSCAQCDPSYVRYVPDPDDVEVLATTSEGVTAILVTLRFRSTCERVARWGTVTRVENAFSVDAKTQSYRNICLPMLSYETHEYELGHLADGDYTFTFMAWGDEVMTVEFTLPQVDEPTVVSTALG